MITHSLILPSYHSPATLLVSSLFSPRRRQLACAAVLSCQQLYKPTIFQNSVDRSSTRVARNLRCGLFFETVLFGHPLTYVPIYVCGIIHPSSDAAQPPLKIWLSLASARLFKAFSKPSWTDPPHSHNPYKPQCYNATSDTKLSWSWASPTTPGFELGFPPLAIPFS